MNTYCYQCPLKSHNRKTEGKTQAHHFCINECSVGKQIKQIGNELQWEDIFMEIVAISETPNHNTMKISLSEPRQDNSSTTYTSAKEGQPDFINRLFEIDGVKSIFYVMDFISVDKEDDANWDDLLPQIQDAFNE